MAICRQGTLAAGIPTYLALFGRDMIAAAWQASLLSNDMMRGALSRLSRIVAKETNDWRDAQPGRLIHEAHTDPLSVRTVEQLRIGKALVTIRFERSDQGETDYTVLNNEGDLRIIRQPSPWSLTTGWGERVKDVVSSLLKAA